MQSLKTILLMLAAILAIHALSACSTPSHPSVKSSGLASSFVETEKKAFGGEAAIENSFVFVAGELFAFFDPDATGKMKRRRMSDGFTTTVLESDARFSYVMENEDHLLNFVTIGGHIFRSQSFDGGLTWINQIKVVEANMVQWNPGVVKDLSGNWHMLIEADETGLPAQGGVACYYFTSADGLTWTPQGKVIEACGNPYLAATQNGLLVIHGDLSSGVWVTTASTFKNGVWTKHLDRFSIYSPNVHVCDPHAIEKDGKILLSVSVDQNSIALMSSNESMSDLFERLSQ